MNTNKTKKNLCFNPFLPSWEYIPDGEPRVFGDRVYLFGSHDAAGGYVFCQNDYVCWSAPVDDLSAWRYEGEIYKRTQDPLNPDGHMVLYAPDVTKGPDGRYYLYYVLDKACVVSVAVCDTPAGAYEFYGYVHYPDGTRLGEKDGDEPQFDPAVITIGDTTYLYTGFAWPHDKTRHGGACCALAADMLTVTAAPRVVVPSGSYADGTSFEGHAFFEAPSIRKVGDTFYFIYSAQSMTELCYATSRYPDKDFTYQGCIVSNCDLNISSYKAPEFRAYTHGNNHGSICEIGGKWYVFYHRMTHGTWFSRQACIEEIEILPDGRIEQVKMTSTGANGGPLPAEGYYGAYIACNIFGGKDFGNGSVDENGHSPKTARIAQDAPDIEPPGAYDAGDTAYITDITNGVVIGFKSFACAGVKRVTVRARAYMNGEFEIRTAPQGEKLGAVKVQSANFWKDFSADITLPDGTHDIYFAYNGTGSPQFAGFGFVK